MFPSRIISPLPQDPQSEDIFSSGLTTLFTDDVQISHGVPGSSVTYVSPRFGKIDLQIPQHPDVEEGRKLFAHYLWNAGVICADALESASQNGGVSVGESTDSQKTETVERRLDWDPKYWDVRGKSVLELGAGTALPSIISALSGAGSTIITDHPSSPALTTGAIEQNVRVNVLERDTTRRSDFSSKTSSSTPIPVGKVDIFGYVWGTTTFYSPSSYGRPSPDRLGAFHRIIIADCLWMPSQHVNLVKTVLHYLDTGDSNSCALVVAGFHTGREIVRSFFEVATGEYTLTTTGQEVSDWRQRSTKTTDVVENDEDIGGRLKAAEIFEIDVNGGRRPWTPERIGETKDAAKRWCVVAVLIQR